MRYRIVKTGYNYEVQVSRWGLLWGLLDSFFIEEQARDYLDRYIKAKHVKDVTVYEVEV